MRPIYTCSKCARGYFVIAITPEHILRVVLTIEIAPVIRFLATPSYCVALFVRRFRRHRSKFLEARIVPERIEHWIELEERRSERYV
jgi:hypothetical protein